MPWHLKPLLEKDRPPTLGGCRFRRRAASSRSAIHCPTRQVGRSPSWRGSIKQSCWKPCTVRPTALQLNSLLIVLRRGVSPRVNKRLAVGRVSARQLHVRVAGLWRWEHFWVPGISGRQRAGSECLGWPVQLLTCSPVQQYVMARIPLEHSAPTLMSSRTRDVLIVWHGSAIPIMQRGVMIALE